MYTNILSVPVWCRNEGFRSVCCFWVPKNASAYFQEWVVLLNGMGFSRFITFQAFSSFILNEWTIVLIVTCGWVVHTQLKVNHTSWLISHYVYLSWCLNTKSDGLIWLLWWSISDSTLRHHFKGHGSLSPWLMLISKCYNSLSHLHSGWVLPLKAISTNSSLDHFLIWSLIINRTVNFDLGKCSSSTPNSP